MIDAAEVPAAIAARAPRAGVFLDLDGTLAPIVARPELSHVLPEIPSVLARLVGELEVIAAPGSFDSMDAFVSWAREQYASGEGMR